MHIRHQYYMSLYKLMQRPKVTIDPAAADKMFEIATSAGRHPGTLMIRADYLITNHKDPTALIAELRRKATLQPGTWALEKHYEETLVRRALFDSFFASAAGLNTTYLTTSATAIYGGGSVVGFLYNAPGAGIT